MSKPIVVLKKHDLDEDSVMSQMIWDTLTQGRDVEYIRVQLVDYKPLNPAPPLTYLPRKRKKG